MSLGRSKRKEAPSTSFRPNKVRNVSKESPSASTRDDDAQDIEDDGEDLMAGAMNFVDDFGMGDEDAEDFEEDYESEGDMEEDSERSEGDGEDDIVQAEGGPKKASKKTAGDKKAAADEKLDKMRETYSLGHVNTTKLKVGSLNLLQRLSKLIPIWARPDRCFAFLCDSFPIVTFVSKAFRFPICSQRSPLHITRAGSFVHFGGRTNSEKTRKFHTFSRTPT